MTQPPVTLTQPHERAIWKYMNEHARFQFKDLASVHPCTENARRTFWDKLRRADVLKECGREGRSRYFTVMDLGEAEAFYKRQRSTAEGVVWSAMRSMRKFTVHDIAASLTGSEVCPPLDEIRTYTRRLMQARYLKVMEKERIGVRPARYQLIKNSGPLPPEVRRRLVINDPNEDRVVYVEGAQI